MLRRTVSTTASGILDRLLIFHFDGLLCSRHNLLSCFGLLFGGNSDQEPGSRDPFSRSPLIRYPAPLARCFLGSSPSLWLFMITLCATSRETGQSEIRHHMTDSFVPFYEGFTKHGNRIDTLGQFASSVTGGLISRPLGLKFLPVLVRSWTALKRASDRCTERVAEREPVSAFDTRQRDALQEIALGEEEDRDHGQSHKQRTRHEHTNARTRARLKSLHLECVKPK